MSTANEAVRRAALRGYCVDHRGEVYGPDGVKRVLTIKGSVTKYYVFTVRVNGLWYPIKVHRLIAYLKYGEAALVTGVQVRHRDNNSLNNEYDNIVLGSQSDNMMDQPSAIRVARAKHAASHLKKYDKEAIAAMRADGATLSEICAAFGCSKSTASVLSK
jgi:hypothetical protein